jgi:MFS family permease
VILLITHHSFRIAQDCCMNWAKRLPFFYGWVIVAVAFVCFAVSYATWHSFAIFYVAILDEFGWTRAATAAAFSAFTIVYGLSSPLSGWLVDRFGPRVVFPLSALLLGIGLLLTPRLTSIWEFYLLFGVIAALGLSGLGTVPTYALLNNWFARKRGTASGIALAGIGVGTLLLVPVLQAVINAYGWRTAYMVLAASIIVVIPVLSIVFYRYRPQDMGLLPDGEEGENSKHTQTSKPRFQAESLIVDAEWVGRNWTLLSAMRTGRFWMLFSGRLLELTVLQVFLTHQAVFFVDQGFDTLVAASVVAIVGIVGSVAKIVWGMLSDRIGREATYTLACVAGTVGVAIILTVNFQSPLWVLYAYALIFGFFYGAVAVMLPVISADIFHGKRFGSILGGLYIGGGSGSALGAFIGGYVFDMTGAYTWAFILSFPIMWMVSLLYWRAAPRRVRTVGGKLKRAEASG